MQCERTRLVGDKTQNRPVHSARAEPMAASREAHESKSSSITRSSSPSPRLAGALQHTEANNSASTSPVPCAHRAKSCETSCWLERRFTNPVAKRHEFVAFVRCHKIMSLCARVRDLCARALPLLGHCGPGSAHRHAHSTERQAVHARSIPAAPRVLEVIPRCRDLAGRGGRGVRTELGPGLRHLVTGLLYCARLLQERYASSRRKRLRWSNSDINCLV